MLDKGELQETNEGQLVVTKGPNIIHNSDSLMHWSILLVALRINSEAVIAISWLILFIIILFYQNGEESQDRERLFLKADKDLCLVGSEQAKERKTSLCWRWGGSRTPDEAMVEATAGL